MSVSEMAAQTGLSRDRFYDLIEKGVFPMPVYSLANRRPFYTTDLAKRCLEVIESGVGISSHPVLFNRKVRKRKARKADELGKPHDPRLVRLAAKLEYLGLPTSQTQNMPDLISRHFPGGIAQVGDDEIIRVLCRGAR